MEVSTTSILEPGRGGVSDPSDDPKPDQTITESIFAYINNTPPDFKDDFFIGQPNWSISSVSPEDFTTADF